MNILVSACLMGMKVRYDGQANENEAILSLMNRHTLIPVCAEVFGGLTTPRDPAERIGDKVVSCAGRDVTRQYVRGAEEILRLAHLYGCTLAILKERSPSCGHGLIYDGTFTKTLVPGDGVLTERLLKAGLTVLGESEAARMIASGQL